MNNKGAKYEKQALSYLKRQGLKLIAKNFRSRYGEIDLIMQDQDTLVFIEVRARKSDKFGSAPATVTSAKQKKILITAKYFVLNTVLSNYDAIRFDVVGIDKDKSCNWIKNTLTIDS